MHFPRFAAVVASLASAAVTTASPNLLPFLNRGVLDKRALSPEDIKCHKTCGNTIQGATKEGYCDDVAWKQLEERCSECAAAQDNIAMRYHDAIKTALESCGLEAPPFSAAGGQSSSAGPSSVAVQPTSVASVQPTSTGLGSVVSSATGAVTSTTSTSATGGVRADASTTAPPASASNNNARGSHAVPFGPLAVLFAAAML